MIETISNFNRVLICEPGDSLFCQLIQRLFVESVTNDHCNVRTDFTFKINDSRKTKCQ